MRLLLFLFGSHRCLGRLGLGQTLLKFVNPAGSIDELLLTRVKRMTHVANADDDHWLGRARFDHVAACATDFRVHIFRMNICFHKEPQNIPLTEPITRNKFCLDTGVLRSRSSWRVGRACPQRAGLRLVGVRRRAEDRRALPPAVTEKL